MDVPGKPARAWLKSAFGWVRGADPRPDTRAVVRNLETALNILDEGKHPVRVLEAVKFIKLRTLVDKQGSPDTLRIIDALCRTLDNVSKHEDPPGDLDIQDLIAEALGNIRRRSAKNDTKVNRKIIPALCSLTFHGGSLAALQTAVYELRCTGTETFEQMHMIEDTLALVENKYEDLSDNNDPVTLLMGKIERTLKSYKDHKPAIAHSEGPVYNHF